MGRDYLTMACGTTSVLAAATDRGRYDDSIRRLSVKGKPRRESPDGGCPGIIATPMMDRFSGGTAEGRQRVISQEPVRRMGQPQEMAAAVVARAYSKTRALSTRLVGYREACCSRKPYARQCRYERRRN